MNDARAAELRHSMIRRIGEITADTSFLTGCHGLAPAVVMAMATVPRHLFVPDHLAEMAYADRPLAIGAEQTISQPFIVALMTDLLDVRCHSKVLEIGTGSGYQAAVLAQLSDRVYSVERVAELARGAEAHLRRAGISGIHLRQGDGTAGWPDQAPFDRIMVTAAPVRLPVALLEQLAPDGNMVIPVGPPGDQDLLLFRKDAAGTLSRSLILPVSFVPLVGR